VIFDVTSAIKHLPPWPSFFIMCQVQPPIQVAGTMLENLIFVLNVMYADEMKSYSISATCGTNHIALLNMSKGSAATCRYNSCVHAVAML